MDPKPPLARAPHKAPEESDFRLCSKCTCFPLGLNWVLLGMSPS